jgi:hypothetical protein
MEKNQKNILHLLIIIAGAVLALQCLLLLTIVGPITFSNVGTISTTVVSTVLLLVTILCSLLAISAVLTIRAARKEGGGRQIYYLVPFIAGAVLTLLGLAIISFSRDVVSGISSSIMVLIGIQLAALGVLSAVSFISEKGGNSSLIKGVPNYAILLFFLLLIPAAFLI